MPEIKNLIVPYVNISIMNHQYLSFAYLGSFMLNMSQSWFKFFHGILLEED